jgi:hypothetical protein
MSGSFLCKYKNVLGVSGQGIHSYRLFGIAIVDLIMTIIGAYFLARWFRWPFLRTFIYLFILGEFLHYIFCVPSTIIEWLRNIF